VTESKRELALVTAAFVAATIVLTLPLALDLKRTLPSDLSDTLLNTWIIGWDADRLRHGLRGVWDTPIFFPYRGTLAFSETLLGLAIFVSPLYWLTADPVLTYNAAFLLSFVIAGLGMYLLARELTGSRAAAFAGGLYCAFGPFRMAQIAHVQMMATGWIPIALWGLHRYFATRRARWLALAASAWVVQAISNTYVGYFIAIPIAVIAIDGLWRSPGNRGRTLLHLGAATLLAGAMLAPVAAAYYRARTDHHQTRSIEEIVSLSADARSYVVGKVTVGAWRWLPTAVGTDPERELFPGIFAVALGTLGLLTAGRVPRLARWARLYGLIVAIALVLSMGPIVRVWGMVLTTHGPYGWLLRIVPGMDGMRVPARFAIVVVAGLAVLVACGVAWLMDRVSSRARPFAAAVCLIAIVADGWAAPIPIVHYSARGRAEDRGVASWLADRAPGALLHLPLRPAEYQTLHYQFVTLVHGHPIVNGYSGYGTPLLEFLDSAASPMNDADRFPAAVRMLRSIGVRYVIVHPGDYDAASIAARVPDRVIQALGESSQVTKTAGLPGVAAFELAAWTPAPERAPLVPIPARELSVSASESADRIPNLFDGDRDTRWIAGMGGQDGSSWLRIQLPRPIDVARVEIQIAERSINDYPRLLRIEGEDAAGPPHVLYDGSPYPELAAAVVRDGRYPRLEVSLPQNQTVTLWIRQTAQSRASWSIHELSLWRYDASGGIR
jgi:hypothetical protein